jgi:hypothetical protein
MPSLNLSLCPHNNSDTDIRGPDQDTIVSEVAEDPFPPQEEGWDVICPSCKDCLWQPDDDKYLASLNGSRFFCKWKTGYHTIREGVCGRYIMVYETIEEFHDRYPWLLNS